MNGFIHKLFLNVLLFIFHLNIEIVLYDFQNNIVDSFLRKSFDTTTQSGNMKLKEQPVTENQQLLIYSVCLQGRDCIR